MIFASHGTSEWLIFITINYVGYTRISHNGMSVYVSIDVQLSRISGPFWKNDEYLVVADYNQQNVYQLKLDSGEVRAIPMSPCHPVSMTFGPYINGLYMTCVEDIDSSGDKKQYRIRKKTFDEKINQAIYNAPQSVFACLLFIVLCNPIVDIPNQSCVTVSATFQVALCINQRTVREPRACPKACHPYHSQPDLWNAISMLCCFMQT